MERRRQKTIASTTDMMTSEIANVMSEPSVPTYDKVSTGLKAAPPRHARD